MNKLYRNMLSTTLVVSTMVIGNAFAGTATANMGVSANVTASCEISASALGFGSYDPVSANSPGGSRRHDHGTGALAQAAVSCNVSTSGVAFGTYDSTHNQDRDTSGTISVTCSGTAGDAVNYSLSLNTDTGSLQPRTLTGGTTSMQYNVFTDASRSQIWGDGTSGTLVVSDSYTLAASPTIRQYNVYGRIPGGQGGAIVSTYTDMITVTLEY